MNIFLPEDTVTASVQALDDKRLCKQILECKQIYDVAVGKSTGYAKHPVVEFYKDQLLFLTLYGLECCKEYRYRFEKEHKYEKMFRAFHLLVFSEAECTEYRELYAAGSKGSPECVRETDPMLVHVFFRAKLIIKWRNDKISPKWTKRGSPKWYKIEEEI